MPAAPTARVPTTAIMTDLRNIAIIAHVDHGKTTLVDGLLRQSGAFRSNQRVAERALDSNALERERGITILAKCTSVEWGAVRINIVDTPGHADFGGEVERVLGMVDGCLLLVDASEGPMPQTKFVLAKALAAGLAPIVVVNKVDKPDARPFEVQDETFDLFAALDADERQLDFPTLFASAKEGWAAASPEGPRDGLGPLFETVLERVPPPRVAADGPFAMAAAILESDPFLGRVLTGRIESGEIGANRAVHALRPGDGIVEARPDDTPARLSRPEPDSGRARGGRRYRGNRRPADGDGGRHAGRARSHPSHACPPYRPANAGTHPFRERFAACGP